MLFCQPSPPIWALIGQALEEDDPGEEEEEEGEEGEEGDDEGDDDGKGEGEKKDEGKKEEVREAKPDAELAALVRMALDELDKTSPTFTAKEIPTFEVTRAFLPEEKKSARRSKEPPPSPWAFVNLPVRRARYAKIYDHRIAQLEKALSDAGDDEKKKEELEKQVRLFKAQKNVVLKYWEQVRCRLELIERPEEVHVTISTQSLSAEMTIRQVKEQWKQEIVNEGGVTILEEKLDSSRGKKIPGVTFIYEQEDPRGGPRAGAPEGGAWCRRTSFIVPKSKGAGKHLITFNCRAPKARFGPALQKDFEFIIQQTRFLKF
ncbi:MAG: hypothetical protein HY717_22220 [Planctomycetes bacterium]|nr:hypothetical protein [Planctomycetota bacterium]